MDSETEVARSIDELREEIGGLSKAVLGVRFEDFKKVVLAEIQYVISDHYQNYLSSALDRIDSLSSCPLRKDCRRELDSIFQDISACFLRNDFSAAQQELDRAEALICGLRSPCQNKECHNLQIGMVQDVRSLVAFIQRIYERIGGQGAEGIAPAGADQLDPAQLSKMVAPLSHPARLQILEALSLRDRSFTDLSRELDMRTGHLQFHLRPLLDEGYVSKLRNRGDYSLTPRGRAALDLLAVFSQRLAV